MDAAVHPAEGDEHTAARPCDALGGTVEGTADDAAAAVVVPRRTMRSQWVLPRVGVRGTTLRSYLAPVPRRKLWPEPGSMSILIAN